MKKIFKILPLALSTAAFLLIGLAGNAQNICPANGFGTNGEVIHHYTSNYNYYFKTVLQTGNVIVSAGSTQQNSAPFQVLLARHNPDGTPDLSLNGTGYVTFDAGFSSNCEAYSMALYSPDKYVLAGRADNGANQDLLIMRVNQDGTLDNTFASGGIFLLDVLMDDDMLYDVAVQTDGKIVACGYSQNVSQQELLIIRLNPDGTLDNTFDSDGVKTITAGTSESKLKAVAIQSDGQIVVGGFYTDTSRDIYIARLNSDGSFDLAFNGMGYRMHNLSGYDDEINDIEISGGNIYATGNFFNNPGDPYFNSQILVVKLLSDGTYDNSFSDDGRAIADFGGLADIGQSLSVLSNGKIMVGGMHWTDVNAFKTKFAFARFNTDGNPDLTFNGTGTFSASLSSDSAQLTTISMINDNEFIGSGAMFFNGIYDATLVNFRPCPVTNVIDYSQKTVAATGLCVPNQITVDTAGNLFIANHTYGGTGSYANTVAKLDKTGNLSVFVSGYTWPSGITIDKNQNLYFTQNNASSNITKVTPGGLATTFVTLSHQPGPISIYDNGDTNLFALYTVSHWGSKGLLKTLWNKSYSTFYSGDPYCVDVSADGQYLYTIFYPSTLKRFKISDGTSEDIVTNIQNYSLWAGTVGPDEKYYFIANSVSDTSKKAVFRFDGINNCSEIVVGFPKINELNDLVFQKSGASTYDLYITEVAGGQRGIVDSNRVIKFSNVITISSNLDSGLVAYYPFNGNANDESGNGNNGTVNGATLTTDRFGNVGKAFSFNFTSNNIVTSDSLLPISNQNRTVSLWFFTNINHIGTRLFQYGNEDINQSFHIGFGDNTNEIRVSCFSNPPYFEPIFNYQNSWVHLVAMIKNDSTFLYVNNNLLLANNNINIWNTVLNDTLQIGNQLTNTKIDDIRIYNRALTEAEIDSLYHEGGWPLAPQGVTAPTANNTTRCGAGAVSLSASGADAGEIYKWYDAASGGSLLHSDTATIGNLLSNYNPTISTSVTLYVCLDSVGIESNRIPVSITINNSCQEKIFFTATPNTSPYQTIWSMNTDGTGRLQLFNDNYGRFAVKVSSDKSHIFYIKDKTTTNEGQGDSIWLCKASIDGTNEQVLWLFSGFANYGLRSCISLTADEQKLLYITDEMNNRDGDIFELDLNTLTSTNLTNDNDYVESDVAYIPLSDSIVYTKNGTPWYADPFPMYKMKRDGSGNYLFIPKGSGHYHWPNFTKNGSKMIYSYVPSVGGTFNLFIANSDGSNSIQVIPSSGSSTNITYPSFSPNDQSICFIRNYSQIVRSDYNGLIISTYDTLGHGTITDLIWTEVSTTPCSPITINQSPTICQGDSIFIAGSWRFAAGSFADTLQTYLGCDSIINTNLIVNPLPDVMSNPSNQTICNGESSMLNLTSTSMGATFAWTVTTTNCSGASPGSGNTISQNLFTNTTGSGQANYSIVATAGGCNSLPLNVTVNIAAPAIAVTPSAPSICYGSSVNLSASGGITYNWAPSASLNNPTLANVIANPLSSTTYTLTATDNYGCMGTTSVIVTVNPNPILSVTPSNPSICTGGSVNLNASGANTYNWSPPNGLNSTSTANVVASPTSTTIYTVSGLSANGCSGSTEVTVTVNAGTPGSISASQTNICAGQSTTITAANGTSYLWNTGSTSNAITVSPTVTTTYSVTIVSSCGSEIKTQEIIVTPLPSTAAGPDVAICQGDTATITGSGANTYLWSTGATTAIIQVTPSTTTAYTVTATNSCGTATDKAIVTVNLLPVANAGLDKSVCPGASTTLSASGGTAYAWSTGEYSQTITVSPTATTIYTLTASNSCGSSTDEVTVTFNSPFADAGNEKHLCKGSSTTLTATGGTTYHWNTGANTASITVSPTATTVYSVTASSSCGSATNDVIVYVHNLPTAYAGMDRTVCLNDTVTLIAFGGSSYKWNTGTLDDTLVIVPATTTTYIVTVTDSLGCSNTDNIIVTVRSLPVVSISGNTVACSGTTFNWTASGGTSYLWSTGGTSNVLSITANLPVSHTVTATNSYGCKASASKSLTVNPVPIFSLGPDSTICFGKSIVLKAADATTYSWNTGATTDSIVVQPASNTTYSVTATNSYGCKTTDNILIGVQVIQSANAGADVQICINDSVMLQASGGVSYIWNNGKTDDAVWVVPLANTTYTVTATDIDGCKSTDNVLVTVRALPSTNAGADKTICLNATASLSASGASTYEWSNGATTSSFTASPSVTTVYTVTGTNVYGCWATDEASIIVNLLPPATINGDTAICLGTSASLNAEGGVSYKWNTGATTGNLLVTPTIPTTYSVTVTDTNSCKSTTSVLVNVTELHFIDLGPDRNLCKYSTDTLIASGGVSYSWSNGSTNGTIYVTPLSTTTYSVTAIDAEGCRATDNIKITILTLPNAYAGADKTVCLNVPVTLTGSGGTSYLWSSGETSTSITVNPSSPGTYVYTVTAIGSNGCSANDSVKVTVNPLPVVNLGPDISETEHTPVLLDAGLGFQSYHWNTNANTQTITVSSTGTYSVTVTSTLGCKGFDTINVAFLPINNCHAAFAISSQNGNSAFFVNQSTGDYNLAMWNFGDGEYSNSVNSINHVFPGPGFYNVCITINDESSGCMDEACLSVQIQQLPSNCDARITYTALGGNSIQFSSDSSQGTQLNKWFWEFGTGASSFQQNPAFTYPQSGYYTVRLVVRDTINNCISSTEKVVIVGNPQNDCQAEFIYYAGLVHKSVVFQQTATGQGIDQYVWNFGDGSFGNDQLITHQYQNAAFHNVCLTIASTSTGCSHTKCKVIKSGTNPNTCNASFVYCIDSTINKAASTPVKFKGSTFGEPTKTNWNIFWDFGDGVTVSNNINPTHTYQDTGLFLVHLNISSNNCTDDYYDLINLNPNSPGLHAAFGIVMGPANSKANQRPVKFKGTAFGDPARYAWNFGDGSTDTTTNSPTHIFNSDTTYHVCLTVWDPITGDSDVFCEDVYVPDSSLNIPIVFSPSTSISIYPNPVKTELTIDFSLIQNSSILITTEDISGKEIAVLLNEKMASGKYQVKWNLEGLAKGVYFVRFVTEKAVLVRKVVVD